MEFELADLLYTQMQMSSSNVNKLLDIFLAYLHKHGDRPPFSSCAKLYNVIDSMQVGDIAWDCFGVKYTGDRTENPAPWMDDVYDVWMHDPECAIMQIIGNTDFKGVMDYVPYREYDTATDTRRWQDFMSGDWAWEEAVSHPIIILTTS
jgi:Plavaka transposase